MKLSEQYMWMWNNVMVEHSQNISEDIQSMTETNVEDRKIAKKYAFYILNELRNGIQENNLKKERLPKWIYNTAVRVGKLNNTTFFSFRDSSSDKFIEYREVVSDAQFILDIKDFVLPGHQPSIDMRNSIESTGTVNIYGEAGDPGKAVIVFNDRYADKPIHMNVGYVPYHVPIMFHNMVFQWEPDNIPLISRYIPCVLYINDFDLFNIDRLKDIVIDSLMDQILYLHNSAYGDMYEKRTNLGKTAQTDVGESVIVLGGYDSERQGKSLPISTKRELLDLKTYLSSKDYKSNLIEDLYSSGNMSLDTKIRAYTATSRFCIMVDREASGHIKEYEIVKQNRIPLALFRPSSDPSTWVLADDELVDVNYIKTFEFKNSPLERIDEAIDWAESILQERSDAYKDFYPWR